MAGIFTNGDTPHDTAAKDRDTATVGTDQEQEGGYPTDVDGVNADSVIKYGKEEYPVFDVSQQEFWSNMKADRKRLRFATGSKAQQYMRRTKNSRRPFYIRMQDNQGKQYTRKVK